MVARKRHRISKATLTPGAEAFLVFGRDFFQDAPEGWAEMTPEAIVEMKTIWQRYGEEILAKRRTPPWFPRFMAERGER